MTNVPPNSPLVQLSKRNKYGGYNLYVNINPNCKSCSNKYGYNMCSNKYALCTSAQCDPIPGKKNIYKCYCNLEHLCSMSTKPCNQLKPYYQNGKQYVYSTFNPKQLNNNKILKYYTKENKLVNCFNKLCYIDPNNNKKAYCFCNGVNTNGKWATMGNPKNIYNKNLSGVPIKNFNNTISFWKNCLNVNILKL